jgi:hypothetical protein
MSTARITSTRICAAAGATSALMTAATSLATTTFLSSAAGLSQQGVCIIAYRIRFRSGKIRTKTESQAARHRGLPETAFH